MEKIAGHEPQPVDYSNIPGCTYTTPEVASVGMTEKAAKEAGYALKIGKFPFTASGKAAAAGAKDGFVKLIFDEKYGELLGAHIIGANVTEMIAELVVSQEAGNNGRRDHQGHSSASHDVGSSDGSSSGGLWRGNSHIG